MKWVVYITMVFRHQTQIVPSLHTIHICHLNSKGNITLFHTKSTGSLIGQKPININFLKLFLPRLLLYFSSRVESTATKKKNSIIWFFLVCNKYLRDHGNHVNWKRPESFFVYSRRSRCPSLSFDFQRTYCQTK